MPRRVEEKKTVDEGIMIDADMQQMPMQEIKLHEDKEVDESPIRKAVADEDEGLVNCLRNERVIVRFVPRPNAMIHDKRHPLYGGMATNAKRTFVVPRLSSTGIYKNVLTNSEKKFLEKKMGLELDALSIYNRRNNFWDDSNPNGIGKVTLQKQDNYLDLSIPEDYIKYKILLANKDQIASSIQELEDHPKATYQFVIVSESAETQTNLTKMDIKKKCWMEYGKIEDDADTLRMIIELLEGRPLAPRTKLDFLQSKIDDYIQKDPRSFLRTVQDELLPAKVLIRRCVEAGLIGKKNDAYYLRSDGTPLCEMNEESTLNNAAKYISSIKRSELKYTLEAKLKG